jgi:predicted phage gp36 major capsid-like protein
MQDEVLEQMTKLANDLCDQLEKVEAENKSLKEQLAQVKTASEAPKDPVVSAEVVQATCDALVKAGSISAEQVEDCKKAFTEDPEAAHRTLVQILNAPAQEKTASVEADLSGGTLVSGSTDQAGQDKYASVFQTLGLNI